MPWALTSDKRDPRSSAGVYRDRSTWDRKYEHPETEDIQFYRTVHAIMHVAGKKLNQSTSMVSRDSTQKIKQWLTDFLPSDPSGRWRFDWRDKEPNLSWNWEEKDDDREWSRSISKTDLITPVVAEGNICAEANITMYHSDTSREVNISISSALVSSGSRAFSLARSLQTIADSSDFGLPDADDLRLEIHAGKYSLTGWTRTEQWIQGIDHIDPWAGKITIPGIMPSLKLKNTLKLVSDNYARNWSTFSDVPFGYCRRWGEQENEDYPHGHGSMFIVSKDSLLDYLKSENKWLIITRRVHRALNGRRHSINTQDYGGLIPSSHLISLIDQEGNQHHV